MSPSAPRIGAIMASASGTACVFNLYQDGLASDQVLQLCYLRRRAPRRLYLESTRIEDEFVLPRPELKTASLLPPVDISLEDLLGGTSSTSQTRNNSTAAPQLADTSCDQVRESARKHFLQPRQAEVEEVRQWTTTLTESDWLQVLRSVQRLKKQQQQGQGDDLTGLERPTLPSIVDVCWMLEQEPSDAFVSFVWDHLLIGLLQRCVGSDTSTHEHHLFTLVVSHHSLASLSPKDFRAKVRSRNLRQVDDAFGAQAELALIALYRRQREC